MTHEESCPLCARELILDHQVDICFECHSTLQISGAVSVSTTSEFQAVRDPLESGSGLQPLRQLTPKRAGTEETDSPHCSWCKKEPGTVRKMLSQGRHHICNECVFLCADILRMELGDDFG